ncbi:MBL fold metallo-hydrolase [Candidatus Micrarchaeota archaeon]|nr:MBL fold metallo-hydrolase [Candidatus Micrarchaeota archaeon]
MELVFLGTGGGRINLLQQNRWTGGFRINGSMNIHVDPGPGALIRSLQIGQKPMNLDAIIVTHMHLDHCSDANVLIEAMSHYTLKKRGIIIGSKNSIQGDSEGNKVFTSFHLSKVQDIYSANWGEKKHFSNEKGEFEIEITKCKHEEETCFGFKLKMDNQTIGYTSDTESFPGLYEQYLGCEYLIINTMKPNKDKYVGHLTSNEAVDLLKITKPKMAILTHMGMKMLREGPEKEAAKIEKQSGIRTIPAKDGMVLKPDLEEQF